MDVLKNPKHERLAQLRAEGRSQRESYRIAYDVESDQANAVRMFRQPDIKERVAYLIRRRAVLADLDEVWVLMQLKAIAKAGVTIGNANLDDYFVKNAAGERLGIDLTLVPIEKMAALEEVTVEEFVEGRGEEARTVRRTKIKLRSAANVIAAAELIGKHLRMWKEGLGMTDPLGTGPPIIEVYWRGSPDETTQAPALTDQTNGNGHDAGPGTPTPTG